MFVSRAAVQQQLYIIGHQRERESWKRGLQSQVAVPRTRVPMIYAKHKSLNHDFLASRNLGPAASRVLAALLAALALALDPGVGAHALPPQSRQRRLMRLCSQMLVPRQSLQVLLWRLFQQMLAPPMADMLADVVAPAVLSLAPDAVMLLADAPLAVMLADAGAPAVLAPAPRLCWQMLAPPQSLRLLLWLLCSHFMRPLCGALAPASAPPVRATLACRVDS
jgi:hypothetical protein